MKLRKWTLYLGVATMALSASIFAACGGGGDDDDDDGGSAPSGATGTDEKFVADICKAGAKFAKDLEKVFADISALSDEKKAAEALAKPFEELSNAFSKAKPPSDLKDWHKDASSKLKEAVAALKKGDTESDIFAADSPIPDPPKGSRDRLNKVAANNKDCQDTDFTFGD